MPSGSSDAASRFTSSKAALMKWASLRLPRVHAESEIAEARVGHAGQRAHSLWVLESAKFLTTGGPVVV